MCDQIARYIKLIIRHFRSRCCTTAWRPLHGFSPSKPAIFTVFLSNQGCF